MIFYLSILHQEQLFHKLISHHVHLFELTQSAQALIGQEAPKDGRGAVVGVFGFFGAIGILLAASIGGYLFDAWMPAGPFVLMGAANATLFIIALSVRILADPSTHDTPAEETP